MVVSCRLLTYRDFRMEATLQDTVLHSLAETIAKINSAAQQKSKTEATSLTIVGGASKSFYGEPRVVKSEQQAASSVQVCTREYSGIIDYEPSELVITAKAGTSLLEIAASLRQDFLVLGALR
jgi:glycolate oxidase FAD binding subunit